MPVRIFEEVAPRFGLLVEIFQIEQLLAELAHGGSPERAAKRCGRRLLPEPASARRWLSGRSASFVVSLRGGAFGQNLKRSKT